MINLNDLAKQSHSLVEQRGLDADVISSLKHCAGEVVEATEAYYIWTDLTATEEVNAKHKADFALELADVIICALTASADMNIDIEKAINGAMLKNARRAYAKGNREA